MVHCGSLNGDVDCVEGESSPPNSPTVTIVGEFRDSTEGTEVWASLGTAEANLTHPSPSLYFAVIP